MNNVKTVSKLIEEALNEVKTISPNEALELSKNDKCNLIDIRDSNELQKTGKIENSLNVSRGLLEFALNPEGEYIKNNLIDLNKEIVLFCAAGGRSALAAKTLKDMGYKKVSHVEGGFGLMKSSGFKII
jgi:rhodanese-related sulfurtransferase|tara:strand:+ start:259 stop:645 length:387 start_codon:yes stop_codon:yes gene_type:complete